MLMLHPKRATLVEKYDAYIPKIPLRRHELFLCVSKCLFYFNFSRGIQCIKGVGVTVCVRACACTHASQDTKRPHIL